MSIGIPSEKELQASDNVVYVHSYTRDDGVEVKAHYRSKPPDGIVSNNLTFKTLKVSSSEIKQKKKQHEQKRFLLLYKKIIN